MSQEQYDNLAAMYKDIRASKGMTLSEKIDCRRLLIAFLFKQETGIDILSLADQYRTQRKVDLKPARITKIQHSCGTKSDHGILDNYHLHLDSERDDHDPDKFYGSWEDL